MKVYKIVHQLHHFKKWKVFKKNLTRFGKWMEKESAR